MKKNKFKKGYRVLISTNKRELDLAGVEDPICGPRTIEKVDTENGMTSRDKKPSYLIAGYWFPERMLRKI